MKLTERPFLDLLAAFRSPAPTPGGGSASALAGSLGAALLAMVGAMPKHRAPSEADVDRLQAAARLCAEISDRLAALVDEDAAAYEGVVAAYKLPKESADEKTARAGRIQQALRAATDVPLEVMRQCAAAVEQADGHRGVRQSKRRERRRRRPRTARRGEPWREAECRDQPGERQGCGVRRGGDAGRADAGRGDVTRRRGGAGAPDRLVSPAHRSGSTPVGGRTCQPSTAIVNGIGRR